MVLKTQKGTWKISLSVIKIENPKRNKRENKVNYIFQNLLISSKLDAFNAPRAVNLIENKNKNRKHN